MWDNLFDCVGREVFVFTEGERRGKFIGSLSGDFHVQELLIQREVSKFQLEPTFTMKVNTIDLPFSVRLDEFALWSAIYCNPSLYLALGKEACTIFDVAISMGSTEAVVKSYY